MAEFSVGASQGGSAEPLAHESFWPGPNSGRGGGLRSLIAHAVPKGANNSSMEWRSKRAARSNSMGTFGCDLPLRAARKLLTEAKPSSPLIQLRVRPRALAKALTLGCSCSVPMRDQIARRSASIPSFTAPILANSTLVVQFVRDHIARSDTIWSLRRANCGTANQLTSAGLVPKRDLNGGTWVELGQSTLHRGDALSTYSDWPAPDLIMSDGAYGVGGFPGDPRTPEGLVDWYRPHIVEWSKASHPATTLWFWNTEIGWATMHPILQENGWDYVETIVWDKGISHIAGNVNGDTIRQFPVVTELCIFYRRRLEFPTSEGLMSARQWLRFEWQRSGLPLNRANEACGVRNAATRKYLTQDWLWYFPPPEMMERLAAYANRFGDQARRPYYSLDGTTSVTGPEWARLRHSWNHRHAITNVWSAPPLNGEERYRGNGIRSAPRVHRPGQQATVHLNQKPLRFMQDIISASTRPGDVVWEPFGGLCSASVAAVKLGRNAYTSEIVPHFADLAAERLAQAKTEPPRPL